MDHSTRETTTHLGGTLHGVLRERTGIRFDGSRGRGGAPCDAGRDRQSTEVGLDNPVRMETRVCHIDSKST